MVSMNDKIGTYRAELMLAQCGVNGYAFEYYKYAVRIAREDPESLNQIIKYIYYPMSLHFCQTMSHIERTMREVASRLYVQLPALFERITNHDQDMSPTVSEVLVMLINLKYSD